MLKDVHAISFLALWKVEALGEIEIATKLLEDDSTDQVCYENTAM